MKRFFAVLLSVIICFGSFGFQAYAISNYQNLNTQEYLVQFNIPISNNFSASAAKVKANNTFDSVNVKEKDILKSYDLLPIYCAKLTKNQVKSLEKNSAVKTIEPNIKFKTSNQNLQAIKSNSFKLTQDTIPWGISKIQAIDAQSRGYNGKNIKVAVLDTGIDGWHYDLNIKGGHSVFNDSPYTDGQGHGTHVAGTIAALNNSSGVIGAAPNVNLYAVKVLDNSGYGSLSGIIEGIEWAVNNNINIINMSLGSSQYSSIFENCCNYAYNSGVLIIAAAGNSGNSYGSGDSVEYPARFPSVMAVAATDFNNKRASFSSTGSNVEIAAPGVNIYSTTPNSSYNYMSGTSMACPHVAGAAALVWSSNPSLTNRQVRQKLVNSAMYLGNKYHYGAGLVQALDAIKY